MASGYGAKGEVGRCYWFWKDYSDCIVNCDYPKQCLAQFEDYNECLHHDKEAMRMNAIEMQRRKVRVDQKHEQKQRKQNSTELAPPTPPTPAATENPPQ